jgi:hypothetical protein
MKVTFPFVRTALMVVVGGCPSNVQNDNSNVRLGDIASQAVQTELSNIVPYNFVQVYPG